MRWCASTRTRRLPAHQRRRWLLRPPYGWWLRLPYWRRWAAYLAPQASRRGIPLASGVLGSGNQAKKVAEEEESAIRPAALALAAA
jgi:hypothetical protein